MWQRFSGFDALRLIWFLLCILRCEGALQVTTNITGSEVHFKERLLIEWSGDSSSSHDVGVQQQSENENGTFVVLSGGNTGSSVPWDFGYDFDVGTYAFVVRRGASGEADAQSPVYTLVDPHTVSSTASSTPTTSSSSSSTPTTATTPTTSSSTSASESTPTTAASSDGASDGKLSTGAAVGIGVGVGVVSVVLLGALLIWIYRKGKKAAASNTKEGDNIKQDAPDDHWDGDRNTAPLMPAPNYGVAAERSGSVDYYPELHHNPTYYGELGDTQRSELHSQDIVKAELPPDSEIVRAKGRRW